MYRSTQLTWGSRNLTVTRHLDGGGRTSQIAVVVAHHVPTPIRAFGDTDEDMAQEIERNLQEIEAGIREAREWLSQHC